MTPVVALEDSLVDAAAERRQHVRLHRVETPTRDITVVQAAQPAAPADGHLTVEEDVPHVTANDGTAIRADMVRSVGTNRLRVWTSDVGGQSPAFARQELAFGTEAQRVLGHLHVGVVGAGGTGSAVFEQLVRLGVGEITVVDDDIVELTNITRLHEAGYTDLRRPKVDVLADAARRIGLGTTVYTVNGRVTAEAVARSIVGCDAIFSCTDDHAGRAVLSRTSYRYLIQLIDVGVQISTSAGSVSGVHGSVIAAGPGLPCLHCARQIDPEIARAELLTTTERAAQIEQGYVRAIGGQVPAVGAYTTVVAGLGVAQLLHRLIGLDEPAANQLVWFDRYTINIRKRQPHPGHYCCDASYVGAGDNTPHLDITW